MVHGFLPADPGLTGSKVFLCSRDSHHVSEISEVHMGRVGQGTLRPELALSVIITGL